ncbi:MAG: hypothetical protein JW849_07990 [Phycisphaerae bacterium]|nr:hypothetical protein [Phycisphaerae bacterium]
MIHTHLQTTHGRRWRTSEHAAVTGYLWENENLLEGSALLDWISQPGVHADLPNVLPRVDGFFSLVYQQQDALWAAVDHVRSLPLFYGQKNGEFYLSDDANWVRQQIDDRTMDDLSVAEFLQATYVTGPDTLFPNVKQLQAGEMLSAKRENGVYRVQTHRYFRYVHEDFYDDDESSIVRRMDTMYEGVFARLIRRAAGRTIVVALTGGYDSRLIVLMLRRLGYDNVLCYTGGAPWFFDVRFAQQVAKALGYRWETVEYTTEKWRRLYDAPERRDYGRFAYNLTSLHHLLEWPAVVELHQRGYFPPESIFLAGHTAIATCHTPDSLESDSPRGTDAVVQALWGAKYTYQWASGRGAEFRPRIEQKIASLIGDLPADTPEQAASAFECWEWQERQAKLQINAVRMYEFWGYEWNLPLWTVPATEFWMRVPLRLRKEKWFYRRHVCEMCAGLDLPSPPPRPKMGGRIKRVLPWLGLARLGRYLVNRRKRKRHPLAAYGIVPRRAWKQVKNEISPMTYCINQALKEIQQDCGIPDDKKTV